MKFTHLSLLLLLSISFVASWDDNNKNKDNILNVHVLPHSHNDPGWWYTFEKYYQDWTKGIISSVVEILAEESSRKFIWAEISYFERWWVDQSESVRDTVKKLVSDGQLEFVTAGWVMNDEAGTHMIDIINQLTEGHEWLSKNLNTKPKFGWAIDPFGHSPTMPYVLQQMGIEGIIINRAHMQLKEEFRNSKKLEFQWQGDQLNGSTSFNMLTHMLPWKLYDIPNTCGPDWDVCATFDFERDVARTITEENVKERSETLVRMYKEKAKLFRHNSVLIPLGDDFKYKTPDMTRRMFTQYELLFKYINSHPELGVKIQWSTLSQYFADLQEYSSSTELPVYQGDFFTYCDQGNDYWSGYFTTRPFMKGLTRDTQAIIRAGELLTFLASTQVQVKDQEDSLNLFSKSGSGGWLDKVTSARRNVALFQHHDGVTGTARRDVVRDYADRLRQALRDLADLSNDMALVVLTHTPSQTQKGSDRLMWTTEPAARSEPATQRMIDVEREGEREGSGGAVVVVFNSLAHPRAEVVSILVNSHSVAVVDGKGNPVTSQIDPIWENGNPLKDKFTLHFLAEVQGVGLTTYFLKPSAPQPSLSSVIEYSLSSSSTEDRKIVEGWHYDVKPISESNQIVLENGVYHVELNSNGKIKTVSRTDDIHTSLSIEQTFMSYTTYSGGAYLFLPKGPASLLQSKVNSVRVIKGPLVSTAHSIIESPIKELIVRTYECYTSTEDKSDKLPCPQAQGVEALHTVDLTDGNTEIVTRFNTDVDNAGKFFTDSNGLDMREREYNKNYPIQGNYYPITAAVYIESQASKSTVPRFTVLSHQAHGATSLKEGELEIMLDRRLNQDDGRGLGEPVTDNVRTLIPLWLVVEEVPIEAVGQFASPSLSSTASQVWHSKNYPLHSMYTRLQQQGSKEAHEQWAEEHHLEVAPLASVPEDLQIFTLVPRPSASSDVEFLVRFYRPPVASMSSEDSLTVDVKGMFSEYSVGNLKEMSLSLLHERSSFEGTKFTIDSSGIVTMLLQLSEKSQDQKTIQGSDSTDIEEEPIKHESEEETPIVEHKPIVEDDPIVEDKPIVEAKPIGEQIKPAVPIPKQETKDRTDNVNKQPSTDKLNESNPDKDKSKNQKNHKDENKNNDKNKNKSRSNAGRVGKDITQKLKDKSGQSNTTSLYTVSVMFYLGLLVVVVAGALLLGRRRASNKDKQEDDKRSIKAPSAWKEREDSMMKLL